MQPRTVSLRTFLIVVGILTVAFVIGLAGIGRIEIAPATVDATTSQYRPQEYTYITQEEGPDHPDQALLSNIYEEATQSVVSIQVRRSGSRSQDPEQGMWGQGSGWIWDEEGHIVTNSHVVEGAADIYVTFDNDIWAKADLIAHDPQSDLAVLQVDAPRGMRLRPLERAAALPKVGHYTIALGSPFGLENSMTLGIVSALGRSLPVGNPGLANRYSLPEVVQTDAAINPGNSGGPLLNLSGQVVGINFAIRTEERSPLGTGVNSGVGFAIPILVAERVVPALIEDGAYRYPFLGIAGRTITAPVASALNLDSDVLGVQVNRVLPDGPSSEAGLRNGDIIVSIDGFEVRNFEDVISYLVMQKSPGETVEIGVQRRGRSRTFEVELGTRPEAESNSSALQMINSAEAIGIAADEVSEEIGRLERSSARGGIRGGVRVWIVTLEGDGQRATVLVDALSGEVLSLELNGGN
ncbi:MAG: PDZ domain-containing protein [Caldilineaceae bacterium SB0670_bin_27]|uniref:PDZ domain-containing protein n=1 Tax=Caldilineaceae bacterium SB0664_bin_27 TaxID=2605260 RepID=A0A6B0Z2Q3_9CHLR|nr:PDZ domain-containing protein [Caldilineaceae bacterium SB0664_bin_27]MYJ78583.1 PDZ domain-containing protein [Caldilineaceae bacterium SB0670_bin_27]